MILGSEEEEVKRGRRELKRKRLLSWLKREGSGGKRFSVVVLMMLLFLL